MDYKSHYDKLIRRGQNRLLEGYSEKHHIVPRCIGGGDEKTNIAVLTAREHYIAHQLLVKMYPNHPKLIFAAHRMTSDPHGHRSKNRLYGWLRKQHSVAISKVMMGVKRGLHTEKTKRKMSKLKKQFYIDNPDKTTKGYKLPPLSDEHKKKISLSLKGRKHSAEHIRRNSEAHKGQIPWCKGKKRSPLSIETKTKISNSLKGKPWTRARRLAYEAKNNE